MYVVALDVKKNQVIVGSRDYLACKKIKIAECNWIIKQPQKTEFKILVKLRNTSNPVKGKLK